MRALMVIWLAKVLEVGVGTLSLPTRNLVDAEPEHPPGGVQ
jgi:hypothetical protein